MKITEEQLDALKVLFPEWVITDYGINDDGQFGGDECVAWDGMSQMHQDMLAGEIERAWLKREDVAWVEVQCTGQWSPFLTPWDVKIMDNEEAPDTFSHGRGGTKLAAYLSANASLSATEEK